MGGRVVRRRRRGRGSERRLLLEEKEKGGFWFSRVDGSTRAGRRGRASPRLRAPVPRRALARASPRDDSHAPEDPAEHRRGDRGAVSSRVFARGFVRGARRRRGRARPSDERRRRGGVRAARGAHDAPAPHLGRVRGRPRDRLRARAERGRRGRDGGSADAGRVRDARDEIAPGAGDGGVAGPRACGVERRDVRAVGFPRHRANRTGREGGPPGGGRSVRARVQRRVPLHGRPELRLGRVPRHVRPARDAPPRRDARAAGPQDSIRQGRPPRAVPGPVRAVRRRVRVRPQDQVRRHHVPVPAQDRGVGEDVGDQARGVHRRRGAATVRRLQRPSRGDALVSETRSENRRVRAKVREGRARTAVRGARFGVRGRRGPEAERPALGRRRRGGRREGGPEGVPREAPVDAGREPALERRVDGPRARDKPGPYKRGTREGGDPRSRDRRGRRKHPRVVVPLEKTKRRRRRAVDGVQLARRRRRQGARALGRRRNARPGAVGGRRRASAV